MKKQNRSKLVAIPAYCSPECRLGIGHLGPFFFALVSTATGFEKMA
ncbi:hypothetical protein [Lacticaseibacillus manihotivorans]|nr:hypothetical protein [Lacticaseibacillus manihotivorans]